ncbi:MAG: ATP-dependent Clp protease adaptor ClpS, partial [Caulobacteraceae bacterium]|nr:ATP-dependent Clp protease adaptor ClpS [Caulobacteraceae bacterium]
KKQSTKSKRGKYQVTLHNDNHNTFNHVVYCLVDACGHNEMQAHQCALIVHNVGVHEYFLKNKLKSTLEKHVKKNS